MLLELDDMPDEAQIRVFVASRVLTDGEQLELRTITDEWLSEWHDAFGCLASKSRVIVGDRVLVWAVDDKPRILRGITGGLTGTELDPLFRKMESFESKQMPPLTIRPNEALIINNELIPFGPEWGRLMQEGLLTPQTLILRDCSVADWGAGKFVHQLINDPMATYLLGTGDS